MTAPKLFGGAVAAPAGPQPVLPTAPAVPLPIAHGHVDPLGLGLTVPRQDRPACALIFYGPSGIGKSSEVARAFNRCLFLGFRKDFLWDYERWFAAHPEEAAQLGLRIPATVVIPKFQPDGRTLVDTIGAVKDKVWRIAAAQQQGICPYSGIVIDEGNTLGQRAEEEIRGRTKDGDLDHRSYKKIDRVKDFFRLMCELPSATGLAFAMVCHEMQPVYDTNDGTNEEGVQVGLPSPTFGQLLLPGGPKMPYKTMPDEICQSFDIVLHGAFGTLPKTPGGAGGQNLFGGAGGTERVIHTQPTPKWSAKCHGATAAGIDAVAPWDVRAIVERAGFHV